MLRKHFQRIIAFEPNPETFQILSLATQGFRNITPLNIALSDHDGQATLFIQRTLGNVKGKSVMGGTTILSADQSTNLIGHEHSDPDTTEPHVVKCQKLDSFLETSSIRDIAVAKIDVEGAEFLVLDGMKRTLSDQLIRRLVVEVHDLSRKEEFEDLLEHYHYRVLRWIDNWQAVAVAWH